MLILSVFGMIEGLTDFKVLQFGAILTFLYIAWAIGQFYEKGKILSYVKGFVSYVLGYLSFSLSALLIGALIDIVVKH